MGKRGPAKSEKLATICAMLNKSEIELANFLGLSLAALKSIDRPTPPLYLKLALTGIIHELEPDKLFSNLNKTAIKTHPHLEGKLEDVL